MTIVSTSSSGSSSSSSSPGAHLAFAGLVNKKLACTCHLAVGLLEFKGQHRVPFTRQPRNVLQKCQMHLIYGAGCIFSGFLRSEETHTLRPGPGRKGICTNVIFLAAAIILWDYPCQDNFGVSYLRKAAAASLNLWQTTEMFTLSQDGCVVFWTSLPPPSR